MATGTLIGLTAISTAVSIYGQRKASRAKEDAANFAAETKRQQALDLIERFEINTKQLLRRGEQFKSEQISAFVKGGVSSTEGSSLLALERTNRVITRSIELDRIVVDKQAENIRRGADLDSFFADELNSAKDIQSLGLFLSGASLSLGIARRGGLFNSTGSS